MAILEVAQLERLSDSDVLLHFYRDILQSQPDEQELRWFTEALARLEREEGGGAPARRERSRQQFCPWGHYKAHVREARGTSTFVTFDTSAARRFLE